jgi:hypothetical protein
MKMQSEHVTGAGSRFELAVALVIGVGSGLAMALAALLLIAPYAGPPPAFPFQDKVFHGLVFACLAGPGVVALPRKYLWSWLGHMIALAAGIEIVQPIADAGRTGSFWDFLADLAGIAVALALGRAIRARFEAR